MRRFASLFWTGIQISTLSLGLAHASTALAEDRPASFPSTLEEHSVVIVEVSPQAITTLQQQLTQIYRTQGTDAVAEWVHQTARNPQTLPVLRALSQSRQPISVALNAVHPDEKTAIEWINKRLNDMGVGSVQFTPDYLPLTEEQAKKTPSVIKLSENNVSKVKYLRYTAGAGVALLGALYQMAHGAHGADYVGLITKTAGAGFTSVLLELQFANPFLKDRFWNRLWRLGGPLGGRSVNIAVNTLYGMALWAGSSLAVGAAGMMGYDVSHAAQSLPAFTTALETSFTGGLIFHAAMGQYQTDLSIEQNRNAISPEQNYRNETTGVVLNNGARVASWIVPGPWSNYVMAAFFAFKTLPQLLKTHFQVTLEDAKTHRLISPETAPDEGWIEKCENLLGSTQLVNLPTTQRQ